MRVFSTAHLFYLTSSLNNTSWEADHSSAEHGGFTKSTNGLTTNALRGNVQEDTQRQRRRRRRLFALKRGKWPNGKLLLDPTGLTQNEHSMMSGIVDDINTAVACTRFRIEWNRTSPYRARFKKLHEQVCHATLGYTRGGSNINLGPICFESQNRGLLMHELSHVIGLCHTHSRPDASRYVTINVQNVQSWQKNVITTPITECDTFGLPYDFDSIMQYRSDAFSNNGQPTMVMKSDPRKRWGMPQQLSEGDVKVIGAMYGWNQNCSGQTNQNRSSNNYGNTGNVNHGGQITSNNFGNTGNVNHGDQISDKNKDCVYFGQQNLCVSSRYASWMKANCAKTCEGKTSNNYGNTGNVNYGGQRTSNNYGNTGNVNYGGQRTQHGGQNMAGAFKKTVGNFMNGVKGWFR